jgi:beta-lactamase class D
MKSLSILSLLAFIPVLALFISSGFPEQLPEEVHELDLTSNFEGVDGCFILFEVETGKLSRYNPVQCRKRRSPCSTFKIPNSLIGLETGVIAGADHLMKWDGKKRWRKELNQDHDLRTAIRDSVVWYYQRLAEGVGVERMNEWLQKLEYGNQDTSGGLNRFWLESSLEISAEEQLEFLKDLFSGKLPFSERTTRIVKDILVWNRKEGKTLRAKTGSGMQDDKTHLGWWIGHITAVDRSYIFVTRIEGDDGVTGMKARKITLGILKEAGIW